MTSTHALGLEPDQYHLNECHAAFAVLERLDSNYDEFRPRTMRSLSNAFRSAFKQLEPVPQFRATAKFGQYFDARFSRSLEGGWPRSHSAHFGQPQYLSVDRQP
jgi:hypothetical protein